MDGARRASLNSVQELQQRRNSTTGVFPTNSKELRFSKESGGSSSGLRRGSVGAMPSASSANRRNLYTILPPMDFSNSLSNCNSPVSQSVTLPGVNDNHKSESEQIVTVTNNDDNIIVTESSDYNDDDFEQESALSDQNLNGGEIQQTYQSGDGFGVRFHESTVNSTPSQNDTLKPSDSLNVVQNEQEQKLVSVQIQSQTSDPVPVTAPDKKDQESQSNGVPDQQSQTNTPGNVQHQTQPRRSILRPSTAPMSQSSYLSQIQSLDLKNQIHMTNLQNTNKISMTMSMTKSMSMNSQNSNLSMSYTLTVTPSRTQNNITAEKHGVVPMSNFNDIPFNPRLGLPGSGTYVYYLIGHPELSPKNINNRISQGQTVTQSSQSCSPGTKRGSFIQKSSSSNLNGPGSDLSMNDPLLVLNSTGSVRSPTSTATPIFLQREHLTKPNSIIKKEIDISKYIQKQYGVTYPVLLNQEFSYGPINESRFRINSVNNERGSSPNTSREVEQIHWKQRNLRDEEYDYQSVTNNNVDSFQQQLYHDEKERQRELIIAESYNSYPTTDSSTGPSKDRHGSIFGSLTGNPSDGGSPNGAQGSNGANGRRGSIPSAEMFFSSKEKDGSGVAVGSGSPMGASLVDRLSLSKTSSVGGTSSTQGQVTSILKNSNGSKSSVTGNNGGNGNAANPGSASNSKTKTTMRSALLGEHQDATNDAKVLKNTSEISIEQSQHRYGWYWRSTDMEKNHEIIYDFGEKVHLTEVNLLLPAYLEDSLTPSDTTPSYNPKCIRVCYCADDTLIPTNSTSSDGVDQNLWLPSKRSYVPADSEALQIAWRCEESARFWRLEFQQSWNNGTKFFGVQALQLITEESTSRQKTDGLKGIDPNQSLKLGRMTQEFDMSRNLSSAQRSVRKMARVVGVSVDEAENLKEKFDLFDLDGSGSIDKDEFIQVLRAFTGNKSEISKERFDSYWRDVDSDGSGEVDFEEFLSWYQTVVRNGGLSPEAFYATFGIQRLGLMSERMGAKGGEVDEEGGDAE